MKKIYIIILFIVFNTSFSKENPKILEYKNFLSTLNLKKYYSSSIAAIKYKEIFKNENLNVRDSAYVIFEEFYTQIHENLNELHQTDETNYYILFENNTKIPDVILNYKNDLIENGFDIVMGESTTWIKQNRNFISKNFYEYISPTMKDYCSFINTINKEETENDGSLSVKPTRIAERIIWLEKFISQNPNFQLNNICNSYYKYFLYLILNGTDHTPILNEKNNINKEYILAYDFITLENSKTKTSGYILPFYNYLNKNEKSKAYDLIQKYSDNGIIQY